MAPTPTLVPSPTQAAEGVAPTPPDAAPAAPRKPPALTLKQRKLVELGMPMLERMIADRVRRYPSKLITEENLLGAGAVALHEAALSFREGECASFLWYAKCRVRGGLADAVAAGRDSLRARVERAIEQAFSGFAAHLIIEPALFAGPPDKLAEAMRQGSADALAASFIASLLEGRQASPEEELCELEGLREKIDALEEAVGKLNDKEQQVIRLAYWDGMQLKQIAKALGVSENTPQNWHRSALRKLRKSLLGRDG